MMNSSIIEFTSHINGIPCRIRANISHGHPGGDYEPPEDTEVSFTVMDRRGYPSPWLESKMDQYDLKRIKYEAYDEFRWEDFK